MADILDGSEHGDFLARWVSTAREKLTDPHTGILISAWQVDGTPAPAGFGPEGTSIWMGAHMLQVVDEAFDDRDYFIRLITSLNFAGFPMPSCF